MPPDVAAPDTTQTPAEPAAPAASPAQSSAPAASDSAPQLASFGDALKAASEKPAAATKLDREPSKPKASDPTGEPAAQALKPEGSKPSSASASSPGQAGSEPTGTEPEVPGDQTPEQATGAERPSRRGGGQIAALTTERDRLAAENAQLRTLTTVPPEVQAQIAARLPDDEFNALEARLKREDLTGEYLTTEERQKYTQALQIRDLSAPLYQHARTEAETWANSQRQAVINDAAGQLAPVLRERPYIPHGPISASDTWQPIYEHIADSSLAEGRRLERAELQPKLDEATDRINDLEMELSGLRVGSRGRPLERDGVSGGAVSGRPDFRTASASDLFGAALAQPTRGRNGRYASAGNGRA